MHLIHINTHGVQQLKQVSEWGQTQNQLHGFTSFLIETVFQVSMRCSFITAGGSIIREKSWGLSALDLLARKSMVFHG